MKEIDGKELAAEIIKCGFDINRKVSEVGYMSSPQAVADALAEAFLAGQAYAYETVVGMSPN